MSKKERTQENIVKGIMNGNCNDAKWSDYQVAMETMDRTITEEAFGIWIEKHTAMYASTETTVVDSNAYDFSYAANRVNAKKGNK